MPHLVSGEYDNNYGYILSSYIFQRISSSPQVQIMKEYAFWKKILSYHKWIVSKLGHLSIYNDFMWIVACFSGYCKKVA